MRAEVQQTALIVVRTYPTPAKTGVEISCTAAITNDGQWLRLYPVPYRRLPKEQQFRKYQWIGVTTVKSTKDSRPESFKIKAESIKIQSAVLDTSNAWASRKRIVFPLKKHCLCCIQRARIQDGHPTLGIFKPHHIDGLLIKADSPAWNDAQLAILRQKDLFEQHNLQELEKVPYKFQYRFSCDHADCPNHTLMCTDWEMGESYRKWKRNYGPQWETKFRDKFEKKMIEVLDTHFFVGTLHQHPGSWIIVGLFYPPYSAEEMTLFDLDESSGTT